MQFKRCIVVICFYVYCVLGATASSSEEIPLLPSIFYVNETEECADDHYYCKVEVKLKPKNVDNPPEFWKLIDNEVKKKEYKKDFIIRAFCIGGERIEEKLEQELHQYNLTGEVIQIYCDQKQTFSDVYRSKDTFFGLFFLSYMGFIVYCTIKASNLKKDGNKYQKMFSVITTWREIIRPKKSEDFNRLLCIQGLRTIIISSVVVVHSYIATGSLKFIRNPEYFEDGNYNVLESIFFGSFGLLVQINFTISAWLLSVQLNNRVKNNGEFTGKDLLLMWMNRYLRFLPIVGLILMISSSDFPLTLITHPYFYSLIRTEVKRCGAIWWKNLLFIQNIIVEENEVCSPGMWYIAVDMQLYIIISTFFYISRRFKISMNYFFGFIAIVSVSIQSFNVLTTDNEGLWRLGPRLLPIENMISTPEWLMSYIKPYGSAISYIIGFIFGTTYWHNNNKNIFGGIVKQLFFYGAFIGFPISASYLYDLRANRAVEAILGVTLRPLFSLGTAVGILGMATGSGGYLKKFFEGPPLVFFGNFTYSIYLTHFFVVFGRGVCKAEYIELDDFYYYSNLIYDVILSFLLGIFVYIFLEHPLIKLQKNFVPQISGGKKEEKLKDR